MAKISRDQFRNLVSDCLDLSDPSSIIDCISESEVSEFQIGSKFVYQLSSDSVFLKSQYRISSELLSKLPVSSVSKAYRKGQSYMHFLEPHKNNYYFLRLDVKSFFHSITIQSLKEFISPYLEESFVDSGNSQSLVDAFVNVATFKVPHTSSNVEIHDKQIIPIGFPMSPVLSNLIFRKIDIQIEKYCERNEVYYTRYADDLFFSSSKSTFVHSETFEKEIRILLKQLSLVINTRKTMRKTHTVSLNGYTIENPRSTSWFSYLVPSKNEIRISNKKLKNLKKIIHKLEVENQTPYQVMKRVYGFKVKSKYPGRPLTQNNLDRYASNQLFNKLAGYRSYLISLLMFSNEFDTLSKKTTNQYEIILAKLNKLLDNY